MKLQIIPNDSPQFKPFQVVIDVNTQAEATMLDDIFYYAANNCRRESSAETAEDMRSTITSHVNKMNQTSH